MTKREWINRTILLAIIFIVGGEISPLRSATDSLSTDFVPYSIKAEFVGGYIYPHDRDLVSPAVKGPSLGGQVAFEWHTDGSRQWHLDFNRPTVGVALQVIDLSNPKVLGQMIIPYTYINIPMVRSRVADFNFMLGGGFGFCTNPCNVEGAINDPRGLKGDDPTKNKAFDYNFIIGGPLTFNLQAGVNVDFHVHTQVDITLGVDYNHCSSGSLFQPNAGLNIFDGKVGLKYHPVIRKYNTPVEVKRDTTKLKRWYGEIIASGGAKALYYKDTKYWGCASLNFEAFYRTCRQHRIGMGVDMFYDGAYAVTAKQNADGTWIKDNSNTSFGRTFTTEDKFLNKFRVGLNITNEITIGKFMIGFGFGVYLYDPVKNMEPFADAQKAANNGTSLKRGMFYTYDIDKQDGWNYFRLSAKYYITKHLLAQIAFKTHLQKVEFVEFGIGTWF
ncbi:MAG: acyloxyacyl hydrolase [Paludibacteraceae bacterium]|nr:acyloxyacyl hydrolase [Paludibacteraceae bacterium]